MSKGFFSKTNEARRAGRKVTNPTNQDLILKETFKKEIKHVKLYTQFSPDYVKMGDIVTRKITERDEERFADQEFELERSDTDERRSKRNLSTTSGEYGSFTGPLTTKFNCAPLNHSRIKCDVTRLAEDQLWILRALKRNDIASDKAKIVEDISENITDTVA